MFQFACDLRPGDIITKVKYADVQEDISIFVISVVEAKGLDGDGCMCYCFKYGSYEEIWFYANDPIDVVRLI
jgi:inorganic pyrophosphatase